MDEQRKAVITVLVILFGGLIAGGIMDLFFYLDAEPTLSDFLRAHPGWYWWPLAAVLLFALVLGIHLFVEPFFWD